MASLNALEAGFVGPAIDICMDDGHTFDLCSSGGFLPDAQQPQVEWPVYIELINSSGVPCVKFRGHEKGLCMSMLCLVNLFACRALSAKKQNKDKTVSACVYMCIAAYIC